LPCNSEPARRPRQIPGAARDAVRAGHTIFRPELVRRLAPGRFHQRRPSPCQLYRKGNVQPLRDNGDWNGEINFKKLVMYRSANDVKMLPLPGRRSGEALVLQREAA
jgi:hypothetical protein